jgi:hypothetical protein
VRIVFRILSSKQPTPAPETEYPTISPEERPTTEVPTRTPKSKAPTGQPETEYPTFSPEERPTAEDVIVIGAGVSGLNAAYELCRNGYSVTVLESRSRIGGRVITRTIGEGDKSAMTEAGAGWLHGASELHVSHLRGIDHFIFWGGIHGQHRDIR